MLYTDYAKRDEATTARLSIQAFGCVQVAAQGKAIDYTKKEHLFEQIKSALRKFYGEQSLPLGDIAESQAF